MAFLQGGGGWGAMKWQAKARTLLKTAKFTWPNGIHWCHLYFHIYYNKKG